jgi:hypothetical protein
MKINDTKMATPIEEKIDQNLKVSLIDCDTSAESRRRGSSGKNSSDKFVSLFRMLSCRFAQEW